MNGKFELGMGECSIGKKDVLARLNSWIGGVISPSAMMQIKSIK